MLLRWDGGEEFFKGWTDEEAKEESKRLFGDVPEDSKPGDPSGSPLFQRSNSMAVTFGLQTVSLSALMHRQWMSTEMRVSINWMKVEQYAEEKKEGAKFPPPVIFLDVKQKYHVGDGFHRILAEKKNGTKTIEVDLKHGSKTDAILHNIQVNAKQRGLPFGRGDIRKSIETLLTNPDTKNWQRNKIAEFIGCSSAYISQIAAQNGFDRLKTQKPRGIVTKHSHRVFTMLGEGCKIAEIARVLKVSARQVQHFIRKDRSLTRCPHCNGTGFIERS